MSFQYPFHEVLLELDFDYGQVGGAEFDTVIETTASGREYPTPRWSEARGKWQVGQRGVLKSELDYLIAFFRLRRGRYYGFRMKDWSDFEATDQAVTLDGSPTAQLVKRYQDVAAFEDRIIKKPNADVTFARGGAAYATPSVDTTSGIVTWQPDVSQAPSAVVVGATTVCTVADASLWTVGQVAWVSAPGQTAQLATVQAVDTGANTVTLLLDSSSWTWASGGTLARYPQPSETITWSGTFHVPARFDTDAFSSTFELEDIDSGERMYSIQGLPVVEIRL